MKQWPARLKTEYAKMNGLDLTTKEPEMQQSKELSSLAYIDTAVMERVKPETEPRNEDRERANKEGRSFIAGFDLLDPDKEKAALDAIVNKRNKLILRFLDDRKAVRATLGKLDVTPLAVVPSKAWADICHKAGLVVMLPDSRGQVTVSYDGIRGYGSASSLNHAMAMDYASVVRALFPRTTQNGVKASVILPTPPADVVETLLKAKGMALHVAAVPEAVKFVQTAEELYKATEHPQDEWARRQGYADYRDWVKRDPIVFHNHGSASAIIAQFGEFPIEKEVVDLVMAGDNLIPESPIQAINQSTTTGTEYMYLTSDQYRQIAMAQAAQQIQQGSLLSGGGLAGLLNQQNRNY